MQIQQPLDAAIQKEIAAKGGTIEFCLYNPRSKIGVRAWELKIKMPDGKLKIAIVRDYDFEMSMEEIQIKHFKNRAERNAEICRLYYEQGLSQVFLANLFNMSQPSVSLIIKQMKAQ